MSLVELQREWEEVEIKDERKNKKPESELFVAQQSRLLTVAALTNFKQIVELLKINKLEKDEVILTKKGEGLNIHGLTRHLYHELTSDLHSTVSRETLHDLGMLYETKKMNPPYFFSLEFMAGTYAPFLLPFVIGLGQLLFRRFKDQRAA